MQVSLVHGSGLHLNDSVSKSPATAAAAAAEPTARCSSVLRWVDVQVLVEICQARNLPGVGQQGEINPLVEVTCRQELPDGRRTVCSPAAASLALLLFLLCAPVLGR